jgi:heme oxygenase
MPLIQEAAHVLKQETHACHIRAEDLLTPCLAGLHSREDYGAILRTFYGFFFPLQQQIAQYIQPNDLPDISERRHAALILDDLAALHLPATGIQLCTELPLVNSKAGALGALYVLEGSTLGGRMISRMLLKHPALALDDSQVRFFNGYGEETGPKWKSFVAVLNRETDVNTMVAAANHTFTLFSNWIEKTLYAERHQPK